MATTWRKYPDEVKDYEIDFTAALVDDSIVGVPVVTVGSGITVDRVSHDAGRVLFWLSGGSPSLPTSVACEITTAGGRTLKANVPIQVDRAG